MAEILKCTKSYKKIKGTILIPKNGQAQIVFTLCMITPELSSKKITFSFKCTFLEEKHFLKLA